MSQFPTTTLMNRDYSDLYASIASHIYLTQGGAQRVVLQIKPLEALQLGEADRQLLDLVGVEVERAQLPQLAEVLRQLGQLVLAEVQLGDVADEGQGGRQRGQQVVRQVDGHHLVTKLLYLLYKNRINIEFSETILCSIYAKFLSQF